MAKVMVLGGCGAVGSVAVRLLSTQSAFTEVRIGDLRFDRASALAESLGRQKVVPIQVDVENAASLRQSIAGCDIVLNCVGPFYKNVKQVLGVVLEAGIHYVDVCDDPDATLEILELDEAARAAGVSALIGMGNSPGATNLLARFAVENMLEETEAIDIYHAHGGEKVEGPGVIGHRFHCMSIPIPMFLDGALTHVHFFGDDGIALRTTFDFPLLGNGIPVYPYPHPEQLTLPRYLPVRRVTNRGTVLPAEYYHLTLELCRLGFGSLEPLTVDGTPVIPYHFAVEYILRERERILRDTSFGLQRGCASVVVRGKKKGVPLEVRFHMASLDQALGEGTGIPAAIGVMLMQKGRITRRGVFPPEAGVSPLEFLGQVSTVLEEAGTGGKQTFSGVIVEQVTADGEVKRFTL